jgi:hypothetical protein
MPEIGFFQRPFMLARALSWEASPFATCSLRWLSCALMTVVHEVARSAELFARHGLHRSPSLS